MRTSGGRENAGEDRRGEDCSSHETPGSNGEPACVPPNASSRTASARLEGHGDDEVKIPMLARHRMPPALSGSLSSPLIRREHQLEPIRTLDAELPPAVERLVQVLGET